MLQNIFLLIFSHPFKNVKLYLAHGLAPTQVVAKTGSVCQTLSLRRRLHYHIIKAIHVHFKSHSKPNQLSTTSLTSSPNSIHTWFYLTKAARSEDNYKKVKSKHILNKGYHSQKCLNQNPRKYGKRKLQGLIPPQK